MLGEVLLKLLNALTPDDVREIVARGLGAELDEMLGDLAQLIVRCREMEYGCVDRKLWADISSRFNELRAASREDV